MIIQSGEEVSQGVQNFIIQFYFHQSLHLSILLSFYTLFYTNLYLCIKNNMDILTNIISCEMFEIKTE